MGKKLMVLVTGLLVLFFAIVLPAQTFEHKEMAVRIIRELSGSALKLLFVQMLNLQEISKNDEKMEIYKGIIVQLSKKYKIAGWDEIAMLSEKDRKKFRKAINEYCLAQHQIVFLIIYTESLDLAIKKHALLISGYRLYLETGDEQLLKKNIDMMNDEAARLKEVREQMKKLKQNTKCFLSPNEIFDHVISESKASQKNSI
jgi:hypothetical protein